MLFTHWNKLIKSAIFRNVTTSPITQRMIFPVLELAYLPITFWDEVREISVKMVIGSCTLSSICE